MMGLAFDLAEKYRTLVFVAGDGALGQMMESAELPPMQPVRTERPDWAVTGNAGRESRVITSLYLNPEKLEKLNLHLQHKLAVIKDNEVRWQEYQTDDADLLLIAYGTVGRICLSVMREAGQQGLKVGLLRPQTLWPFADARIAELAGRVQGILVVEMSAGQMLEDVERVVQGKTPVRFHGRMGGIMPMVDEILADVQKLAEEVRSKE